MTLFLRVKAKIIALNREQTIQQPLNSEILFAIKAPENSIFKPLRDFIEIYFVKTEFYVAICKWNNHKFIFQ